MSLLDLHSDINKCLKCEKPVQTNRSEEPRAELNISQFEESGAWLTRRCNVMHGVPSFFPKNESCALGPWSDDSFWEKSLVIFEMLVQRYIYGA